MLARLCLALAAVAAASAQPSSQRAENESLYPASSPELQKDLEESKMDALLLYTDYSARLRTEFSTFLANLTSLNEDVTRAVGSFDSYERDPCRAHLEQSLKKLKFQAHKAALFSGENHHKYLKGHMIVFRMHLNKSEDFMKKSDRAVAMCKGSCQSTPRISRWRKNANDELKRFREDLVFSRRYFRDVLTHARKDLLHLKNLARRKLSLAIDVYNTCRKGS